MFLWPEPPPPGTKAEGRRRESPPDGDVGQAIEDAVAVSIAGPCGIAGSVSSQARSFSRIRRGRREHEAFVASFDFVVERVDDGLDASPTSPDLVTMAEAEGHISGGGDCSTRVHEPDAA